TAAMIATALLLGTLVSTWQAVRAKRAEQLADHRLALATDNLQMAREAVDQMLTQVADKDLVNVPQMEPLRRVLLEKALLFYQRFLQGNPDDPAIRLATGQAYQRIGGLYDLLGQSANAERTLQESIRLLEGLVTGSPQEPQYESSLATSYRTLAGVLIHLQQWQKAEQAARQAVVRTRKLIAEFPEEAAYRHLLRNSLDPLAVALDGLRRYPEAEEAH